jgi:hypothetical protein
MLAAEINMATPAKTGSIDLYIAFMGRLPEIIGAHALARSHARRDTHFRPKGRGLLRDVPADSTSAAPSLLRELRLSRNRQLKQMLQ